MLFQKVGLSMWATKFRVHTNVDRISTNGFAMIHSSIFTKISHLDKKCDIYVVSHGVVVEKKREFYLAPDKPGCGHKAGDTAESTVPHSFLRLKGRWPLPRLWSPFPGTN